MKVIDHTPYFSADGKINMIEKARATMKLGAGWIQESQAQPGVIAAMNRELDKRFSLLRNVTLKGLEISIPFILVGPAGIYAMYITSLRGIYRAKGDLWGTLSGEKFTPAATNLLTRTHRMARAVQVYLERQGYQGLGLVDSALLCSDPGMHVDSVRPIVRVVQSDAIERYASSIAQARATLSPEVVNEIVARILNPRAEKSTSPVVIVPSASEPELESGMYIPPALRMGYQEAVPEQPAGTSELVFDFKDDEASAEDEQPVRQPDPVAVPENAGLQQVPAQPHDDRPQIKKRRRKVFSTRQLILLLVVGLIECVLLAAFLYLVTKTL